jgi:HEAT repeat protein
MTKEWTRDRTPARATTRAESTAFSRCARLGLATALGASLTLCRHDAPHAQQRPREPQVRVTGIAAGGGVVSITADGSLNRAQTWQDEEGFHVVLNNGQSELSGSPRGVKVRRVGNSLELVVPVRRGASVTVEPRGSRLDLVMSDGGADVGGGAPQGAGATGEASGAARKRAQEGGASQAASRTGQAQRAATSASQARPQAASEAASQAGQRPSRQEPGQAPADAGDLLPLAGGAPKNAEAEAPQPVVAGTGGDIQPPPTAQPQVAAAVMTDLQQPGASVGTSVGSIIFSLPALFVALCLALGGGLLVLMRRRRRGEEELDGANAAAPLKSQTSAGTRSESKSGERQAGKEAKSQSLFEQNKGDRRHASIAVPFERRSTGPGAEDEATRQAKSLGSDGAKSEQHEHRRSDGRSAVAPAAPAVMYGAYRVEQEVSRLVQGKSHSVEVIASRVADDRRAVETSLLKALRSAETDEDGRRRVRTALEDYGFVARACASLLLGAESFDRACAAGVLGEMRSAQALPFLTEALYDPDPIVRTETVKSLGALGLPSAIGALLDTARRHSDLSAALLQPALTACSVESDGLAWNLSEGRAFGDYEETDYYTGDVKEVAPVSGYEALPEWVEDATLRAALERLDSPDAEARVHCAQQLAQFQVRRAVEALNSLAVHDAEPAVRAAAVTSLGLINHESVFAPVLVSMADEAREVRAAAARSLSRLSFDRAEAYISVTETANAETLGAVARACIASGLAAQAVNRLVSKDPRQAFEASALLTLVLRSGDYTTVLDAVERHDDVEVRIASVRLLGMMNRPELVEELKSLSECGRLHPRVRLAVMELSGTVREQPQAV